MRQNIIRKLVSHRGKDEERIPAFFPEHGSYLYRTALRTADATINQYAGDKALFGIFHCAAISYLGEGRQASFQLMRGMIRPGSILPLYCETCRIMSANTSSLIK